MKSKSRGITIFEALALFIVAPSAVVGVGSLAAIGPLTRAQEMTNRAVCMGNLGSINKGLVVYKAANDMEWPWLGEFSTDPSAVKTGTNRNREPGDNTRKKRCITAQMFMLVRMGQSPGIFRCPSDREAFVDDNTQADEDDGDIGEGEYYWDFSEPNNVSFSWQSPLYKGKRNQQGLISFETEMVVVADMSPAAVDPNWKPADVTQLEGDEVRTQNTPNHQREQINVLYVAGNVRAENRPDVGVARDNIYTAYGTNFRSRRDATSTKVTDHKRSQDTFLIGPVGRAEK